MVSLISRRRSSLRSQGGGNACLFVIGAGQVGVGIFQLGGTPADPFVELECSDVRSDFRCNAVR